MSDDRTHLKNEAIRLSTKGIFVPHNSTLRHFPCSNCAVERLVTEVLRVDRAVLSKLPQPPTSWSSTMGLIQSVIKNMPSSSRRNHAPIAMFMGKPASHSVNTFLREYRSKHITVKHLQYQKGVERRNLDSDCGFLSSSRK